MKCAHELEELRNQYSLPQRILYQAKKFWLFTVLLIGTLYLTDAEFLNQLLLKQLAKATLGIALARIFTKFAFPKSGLQTEIFEKHNIAMAIIFGAIVLGVCIS